MAVILVVEDEPVVGMQLQESLEAMGHRVPAVVESGDEVLKAAEQYGPDLVLMDIQLRSSMDGIQAASALKALGDIPIIYLTAYPGHGSLGRAMATRPAAYLLKPVSDGLLREEVDRALSEGNPG